MSSSIRALCVAALVACGANAPPPAKPSAPAVNAPAVNAPASNAKADSIAAEQAAYGKARPVFEKYCAGCHTKAGKDSNDTKLEHFDMDTYPFGGEHAPFIGFHIRDVLGLTGKPASMPKDDPGAVRGDDLATIKAWTDAWQAAEQAGAHPPHGDDPDKD